MLIVEVPQTALECRAIAVVVIVNQKSWQQPINSLWWCTILSGRANRDGVFGTHRRKISQAVEIID